MKTNRSMTAAVVFWVLCPICFVWGSICTTANQSSAFGKILSVGGVLFFLLAMVASAIAAGRSQAPRDVAGKAGRDGGFPPTPLLDELSKLPQKEAMSRILNSNEVATLAAEIKSRVKRGPKRPLLYMFQHVVLREAAFDNHPKLISELYGEPSPFPLLFFASLAKIRCVGNGGVPGNNTETRDALDGEVELFRAIKVNAHKRGDFTAFVVSMPVPISPPEAHFVAIVRKDVETRDYMKDSPSTRYFALERSILPQTTALCEWRRDGQHLNAGQGPVAEMKAFVDAVFQRVAP